MPKLKLQIVLCHLCASAEQAGDTMLPTVFFSRPLQNVLPSMQHMIDAPVSESTLDKLMSNSLILSDLDHMLTPPSTAGSTATHAAGEKDLQDVGRIVDRLRQANGVCNVKRKGCTSNSYVKETSMACFRSR